MKHFGCDVIKKHFFIVVETVTVDKLLYNDMISHKESYM